MNFCILVYADVTIDECFFFFFLALYRSFSIKISLDYHTTCVDPFRLYAFSPLISSHRVVPSESHKATKVPPSPPRPPPCQTAQAPSVHFYSRVSPLPRPLIAAHSPYDAKKKKREEAPVHTAGSVLSRYLPKRSFFSLHYFVTLKSGEDVYRSTIPHPGSPL